MFSHVVPDYYLRLLACSQKNFCSAPFKTEVLATNSPSFCFSETVFILPLFLRENFAGYTSLRSVCLICSLWALWICYSTAFCPLFLVRSSLNNSLGWFVSGHIIFLLILRFVSLIFSIFTMKCYLWISLCLYHLEFIELLGCVSYWSLIKFWKLSGIVYSNSSSYPFSLLSFWYFYYF